MSRIEPAGYLTWPCCPEHLKHAGTQVLMFYKKASHSHLVSCHISFSLPHDFLSQKHILAYSHSRTLTFVKATSTSLVQNGQHQASSPGCCCTWSCFRLCRRGRLDSPASQASGARYPRISVPRRLRYVIISPNCYLDFSPRFMQIKILLPWHYSDTSSRRSHCRLPCHRLL